MGYGNISVGSTATKILSENPQRTSYKLFHNGTNDVFLGNDASVTTSNGFPFAASETFQEPPVAGLACYKGDVYGIVASGSEDIRYIERE